MKSYVTTIHKTPWETSGMFNV